MKVTGDDSTFTGIYTLSDLIASKSPDYPVYQLVNRIDGKLCKLWYVCCCFFILKLFFGRIDQLKDRSLKYSDVYFSAKICNRYNLYLANKNRYIYFYDDELGWRISSKQRLSGETEGWAYYTSKFFINWNPGF